MTRRTATPLPLPTEAELGILRVLWDRGPSTVREVHDEMGAATGYTTTLKLLQNMADKRLVERNATLRQHVYSARAPEDATLVAVAGRVVDRLFNGSRTSLVMRALGDSSVTREEVAEMKRLILMKEKQVR
jgi:predicted transcriptional regulator